MIYYLTIHWNSDAWIRVQSEMFRKYTDAEYKTFGFLNGIHPRYYDVFDLVRSDEQDPSHADKLDILARMALEDSTSDADVMIFIDGDAFPIAPVYAHITEYLKKYALVAVQRLENAGEKHAHPSFCVTTTGFWRKYNPSWQPGYSWMDANGEVKTDVGGNLLEVLELNGISWKPLHRSNSRNLHPVLFGLYADLVYHHGTGFRNGSIVRRDYLKHVASIRRWDGRLLLRLTPTKFRSAVRKSRWHPEGRMLRKLSAKTLALSESVYSRILHNTDQFISSLR